MVKEKQKKHGRLRKAVQAAAGFLQNPRWLGIGKGNLIYSGPLKNVCVPGMNCYSCPAAIGACPIGGMQAVFGSRKKFPFYVLGYLALLGILLGRFVCGWLCLFGLVQELLYKIPVPKLTVPRKLDRGLRWLKYVFLILFVIVLPAFWKVNMGLLQVHLPGGNAGGRHSSGDAGCDNPQPDGLAVPVEVFDSGGDCGAFYVPSPALL